jgi:hypothetical protein
LPKPVLFDGDGIVIVAVTLQSVTDCGPCWLSQYGSSTDQQQHR